MVSFTDVDTLKQAIRETDPRTFFKRHILETKTEHFDENRVSFVCETFNREYGITIDQKNIVIVGSSKIGYALHNKIREQKIIAPAFRAFGEDSDIDLSICDPTLFNLLWHELSSFACKKASMPFSHKKLGDYLIYGWLRQDHLPLVSAPNLKKCAGLRDVRGVIRKNQNRGHPKVDFGLFHDIEHLELYQERSIRLCRNILERPL